MAAKRISLKSDEKLHCQKKSDHLQLSNLTYFRISDRSLNGYELEIHVREHTNPFYFSHYVG